MVELRSLALGACGRRLVRGSKGVWSANLIDTYGVFVKESYACNDKSGWPRRATKTYSPKDLVSQKTRHTNWEPLEKKFCVLSHFSLFVCLYSFEYNLVCTHLNVLELDIVMVRS